MLGRKRLINGTDNHIRIAWVGARETFPDALLDPLLDDLIGRLRSFSEPMGLAWSAGKDSMALDCAMRLAGVEVQGLYGVAEGLAYTSVTEWGRANLPDGIEWIDTGQDMAWLKANPTFMFPREANIAGRWYRILQHEAQRQWATRNKAVILTGRRRLDANWVGRNGSDIYTDRHHVTRWSPMADWPHEAVFSLLQREGIDLPPFYADWDNGFYMGTPTTWAQREGWYGDPDIPWPLFGWIRVYDHEAAVVVRAAEADLPGAYDFLARAG